MEAFGKMRTSQAVLTSPEAKLSARKKKFSLFCFLWRFGLAIWCWFCGWCFWFLLCFAAFSRQYLVVVSFVGLSDLVLAQDEKVYPVAWVNQASFEPLGLTLAIPKPQQKPAEEAADEDPEFSGLFW